MSKDGQTDGNGDEYELQHHRVSASGDLSTPFLHSWSCLALGTWPESQSASHLVPEEFQYLSTRALPIRASFSVDRFCAEGFDL